MYCSYIIPDGKYQNFKCNEFATVDNMCERCYKQAKMDKQKSYILCLYSLSMNEYKRFTCQNYANINTGFCERCHEELYQSFGLSYRPATQFTQVIQVTQVTQQSEDISFIATMPHIPSILSGIQLP